MRISCALLALSAVVDYVSADANELPMDLDDNFDQLVEALMAQLHVPGVSVALITKDNVTAKVCPPNSY